MIVSDNNMENFNKNEEKENNINNKEVNNENNPISIIPS